MTKRTFDRVLNAKQKVGGGGGMTAAAAMTRTSRTV